MATAGADRGPGPERAFAPELPDAGEVVLDEAESRHLVRSRRVAEGARVVLFDGGGRTREGVLLAADARAARVRVEGPYPDREPRWSLTVAAALGDAGDADLVVGALAELGASRLVPLLARRSPPAAARLATRRRDRWERLAREAAKVSGRSRLLAVAEPASLGEVVAAAGAAGALLDPDPALAPLAAVVASLGAAPWLLVGPAGGFTAAEREAALAAGLRPARLGATALRTPTAAIAAAAVALAR